MQRKIYFFSLNKRKIKIERKKNKKNIKTFLNRCCKCVEVEGRYETLSDGNIPGGCIYPIIHVL